MVTEALSNPIIKGALKAAFEIEYYTGKKIGQNCKNQIIIWWNNQWIYFLVLIYMLSVPKKEWYVQLLNRYIPSQWHCVCLKHIWVCVFFLYFGLLDHTTCVYSLALFRAEFTGHLPPWLVHSVLFPMPSGFSSPLSARHQLTIFHFQSSVSSRLMPPQRKNSQACGTHSPVAGTGLVCPVPNEPPLENHGH